MANIKGHAVLTASVTIELTEAEAGALDALAGYGIDSFLTVFYAHLGSHYLKPYEAGLRSLFKAVQNGPCNVGSVVGRANKARKVFNGELRAVPLPSPPVHETEPA